MNANNSSFGPPPLSTPITADQLDEMGIPWQQRGVPTGNLHTVWGQWFNDLGNRVSRSGGFLRDTAANMVNYPAQNYPAGSLYGQSDRGGVTYVNRTAAGTVTTAGTAVTWDNSAATGGDMFGSGLAGSQININGVLYPVSTVNSPTSLTLATSAGVQTTVPYSSAVLQWFYLTGSWTALFGSLPTLGANDLGFVFFDTTHWRAFVWTAAGGAPSSLTPGWNRAPGEVPKGKIDMLPFGVSATAGTITGWSLCNGGTISITEDDATTVSVTKPNFQAGAFAKGGAYTGATVAAVVPTIGGHTETATTGISVSAASAPSVTTGTALVGITQSVVTSVTGGGGGGAVTDPAHQHNLTAANAPITLPGDPVAEILCPFYMKR